MIYSGVSGAACAAGRRIAAGGGLAAWARATEGPGTISAATSGVGTAGDNLRGS